MAWISVLEVRPEHRSKGIGSQILGLAADDLRARGVARLGLHVFGRNPGAQRLYARLGYDTLLAVDEADRRRGYARAMVAAAAAELAARNVPYVGLDVPGTEPAALAFAASADLGLELISQRMVKKL